MEATTAKEKCGEVDKEKVFKRNLVILHDTTFFIHQALKSMELHLILFKIRNYEKYYMDIVQHSNFTYLIPLYI